jgi:hypothetical protein
MITQALELLQKHMLWKTQRLRVAEEPEKLTPEEVRFREKIKEQRDSLLEKLVEYAVGTQSNTSEAVTRAVRLSSLSVGSRWTYTVASGVCVSNKRPHCFWTGGKDGHPTGRRGAVPLCGIRASGDRAVF